MLDHLLVALFSLIVPSTVSDSDSQSLRTTAVDYLSLETARDNLQAARTAGAIADVDPDLLLSIAWHESRYQPRVTTKEPLGKTSCGVMTPVPRAGGCAPGGLLEGYLEGAAHLRGWRVACRGDLRCALLGYAGGYVGVRYCAVGSHRDDRRCRVPEVFLSRARWIARARQDASSRSRSATPSRA